MRLIALAALLIVGCDGDPPFDTAGPAASRLAPGGVAIVHRSTAEGGLQTPLHGPAGESILPSESLADGTRLRVVSDDNPARVEFRTAPDVDRSKVDRRLVSVEVLDGPREGEAGTVARDDLRPGP